MAKAETKREELEKKIGYNFKNGNVLEEALTHRSFLHDNPKWKTTHNERLEFLGDAVLELGVTRVLYKKYPNNPEGELTGIRAALVNRTMLFSVAEELGIKPFLHLSRGESKNSERAREAILANSVEALIGAIYNDGGMEEAFSFVERFIMPHLSEVMEKKLYKDSKSELQEIIQEKNKITPIYEVISEAGPDHNKVFKVAVFAGKKKLAEGVGPSKQEAETEAATQALKDLE
ncbi:MAG: ribonuclease III [Candidatus Paceibacterota bacterium]